MEGLTKTLLSIIACWKKSFPQKRSFERAKTLCLGLYLTLGRKTISRNLASNYKDQRDWSADYKLFSRTNWDPRSLFRPILQKASSIIDEDIITVAYDDTLIRKTGRKIKGASWQRDPLSPPFACNLVWGMRYLQASILLPLYNDPTSPRPPRGIPIQFKQLPKFKRPNKRSSEKQHEDYKKLTQKYNSSTTFVKELRYLRNELDAMGYKSKKLLATVDGSYCNRTCLTANIKNAEIIGRTRKNARLYFKAEQDTRRFYNPKSFTPEEVKKNRDITYQKSSFYYGGKYRDVRYKEISDIYWKWATKRKPLRLIVIAPTPYQRNKQGKLQYRQPAYLLTTDLEAPVELLIQKYFDRWQIEVNFQEEKSYMGLGEQQVWSKKAISKVPSFIAVCYGALMLSSVLHFKDERIDKIFEKLPKWRNKKSKRPSCLDLLTLLRRELLVDKMLDIDELSINTNINNNILKAAA